MKGRGEGEGGGRGEGGGGEEGWKIPSAIPGELSATRANKWISR